MAQYEHLPITKGAMDLALKLEETVRTMSRYHKYTLGAELRKRAITALSLIVRANSSVSKAPVLQELRIILEELKQLSFLAKESKAWASFHSYKEVMERILNLSKQNEGWLKSVSRKESFL